MINLFVRRCWSLLAALILTTAGSAQIITSGPQSQAVAIGGNATLSVAAAGSALTYQWKFNGANITGATNATLALTSLQPSQAGLYTVTVTSAGNSVTSLPAIVGVTTTAKRVGDGTEFPDIVHPVTGFTYDQILLGGAAASVTADPGQILRISYIDLTDDIVQVEFSGAGTLTLTLENATGPAAPINYNQSVNYMKGHARIVLAGANETTNLSIFSVGTLINANPALYKTGVTYEGLASIASVAILSTDGKFAGLRSANGSYFATRGVTGIYAPGVQFGGPVFVGDVSAFDAATPMLYVGSAEDARVTGGDFVQANSQSVQLSGISQLRFVNGITSQGTALPARNAGAALIQNGADVTARVTGLRPASNLYFAVLRPEGSATTSLASGTATLQVADDGTSSVSVTFSNLTSPETGAHLRIGPSGDYVANLGLGQVSGRTWSYSATGVYTTAALIEALNTGNIYIGLDTARYPGGELRGTLVTATGSQVFTPPAAAPALAASALASPTLTDAARFLTQATFGPTLESITALRARGISGWIDDQMAMPMTSALATVRATTAAVPPPVNPSVSGIQRAVLPAEWHAAWWKISVTAPDQLRQRIAFALSELLVVGEDGSDSSYYSEIKAKYYDTLLAGAFGNYRQLLEDVSLSVSMGNWLTYLGNLKADPAKGTAPDENYAREVQQLFTIGLVQLQPDGTLLLDSTGQPIPTYDQTTITETAKIFTGWTYANPEYGYPDSLSNLGSFLRRPPGPPARTLVPDGSGWMVPMRNYAAFHETGEKRIVSLEQVPLSEAHPTVIPAGQSGLQDLRQFLDTLCAHPNIGPFVSRHLIQRLVTANPSPGYVYRIAQVWANDGTGTRGNLGAVVRAILTDYEARSPDVVDNAGYGKLKEPIIRVAALLRALKVSAPTGEFLDSFYNPALGFSSLLYPTATGQAPLNAKTVFNFFSPTYSPPGTLAAAGLVSPEMEIVDSSYSILMPRILQAYIYRDPTTLPQPPSGPSPYLVPDFSAYLANAGDPNALIEQLSLVFCGNQMSASTKATLASYLQNITTNFSASPLERVRAAINLAVVCWDGVAQR
jgi:uncharacterized protein (DUF1800 family)